MTTGGGAGPAEDRARNGGWSDQVNALGGFIRAQRQMAKLSLREMASMTRVSNAYLSQVERGLHQPSLKVLHSIADALHLNAEQLLQQAGWSAGAAAGTNGRTDPAAEEPATGPCSVEEAVRAETRLSEEQKTALLGVYRSFLES
ncbi:helix-turn-helix domain-containing protein [Pseudonocardia lutea]|jgi:transcriptional regulator with XRE-family HTH domain|uniref:Helix-turn-helix domain-containing protein n=1 Tax=Pseudonocardia lutea TaxID=2172015 RepID=A0ABW1IFG0_9PSEU